MREKIVICTDGGSRGNPGHAGAGAIIYDAKGNIMKRTHKYLGQMTNNEAEYEAVLLGIATLKRFVGTKSLKNYDIEVRLDSELIARQLCGAYKIKEERLFKYFIAVHNIMVSDAPHISFTHIRREDNSEADALANKAMDSVQKSLL